MGNQWTENGTIKISWRLGVVVTVAGAIIGGAFWAGRFTNRIDDMTVALKTLTQFSQTMEIRVSRLSELAAADDVGDMAVERRLLKIENVLIRIEDLMREEYRKGTVR